MSTVGAIGSTSASSIQMDYMKLLVTQMKNQDPLQPMDNAQMTAQLTQLSQLQQLEKMSGNISTMVESNDQMNSNFAKVLASTQTGYAKSLVGKQISYLDENGAMKMGLVEQVEMSKGQPVLRMGEIVMENGSIVLKSSQKTVSLDKVVSVGSESGVLIPQNEDYAKTLIDKQVLYIDSATGAYKTGAVDGVNTDNGNMYLIIDGKVVSMDSVVSVN